MNRLHVFKGIFLLYYQLAVTTSAGQLLCGGLFSQDPLTAWFSAVALFHSVHHNQTLKESLLQVHMAPTAGGDPVTLLQQCFRLMSQVSFFCTYILPEFIKI